MATDWHFLTSGVVLGLSAGLSPGPLSTLVISETLRHDMAAGAKVAIAPLITDLPIICLSVALLTRISERNLPLGIISFCGAVFLAYLGWESVRFRGTAFRHADAPPRSLRKGVVANLLNPSPYLFWFSIGAPLLAEAMTKGIPHILLFIGPFYLLLVGAKLFLAFMVGRSRAFLRSAQYVWAIRILGLLLFLYAGMFIKNGLNFLGALS